MKNYYRLPAALAILCAAAAPALAEDWYVSGTFNNYADEKMDEISSNRYTLGIEKLTNGFYIHTAGDAISLGSPEAMKLDQSYSLVRNGNDIMFSSEIDYVEGALLVFNPEEGTLLITGNAILKDKPADEMYVTGPFNNWNLSDPDTKLSREPGTAIFSGRVLLLNGDETSCEWIIASSTVSLNDGCWGAREKGDSQHALEGILVKDSRIPLISDAEEYDIWFNSATGAYRLTPRIDISEKSVTVNPSPEEYQTKYAEIYLTFNGYNTATLDPSMYDIYNGPATFTNVASGEVVSRVGGQPFPFPGKEVLLQLYQTIYSQAFLDSVQIEPGDEDKYIPYPDGAYMLKIPAGCIMLNDGSETIPCKEMEYLFMLGEKKEVAVDSIAPEFENMEVYTLDGICKGVISSPEELNALPKGIYVVKGRKMVVK